MWITLKKVFTLVSPKGAPNPSLRCALMQALALKRVAKATLKSFCKVKLGTIKHKTRHTKPSEKKMFGIKMCIWKYWDYGAVLILAFYFRLKGLAFFEHYY